MLAGVWVGYIQPKSVPPPAPPPPTPSPIVRTVEKRVETKVEVKVPYIPGDCKGALDAVSALVAAVDRYEGHLAAEDRILNDAHTAIVGRDIQALNKVVARQREIRGSSLEDLLTISSKRRDIAEAIQRCNAKLN